jgi:folylpolyglutamate synthase/dihydropteroate synthase
MNYDASVRALLALGRELSAPRQPARSDSAGAHVQKFGLENITSLSAVLGDPHRAVRCAHIAGTNGPGSAAAMLE